MPSHPLRELLRTAPIKSCKGTGYRLISVRYHARPLSAEGSRRMSGRFHAAGEVEAIYIALDPVTTLYETGALLQSDQRVEARPANPRTLFAIHYDLPRVLDLTDQVARDAVGYSLETVLGNWRRLNPNAPTQLLGRAAHEAGIQGIIYPSYQNRGGTNLVVFPRSLLVGHPGSLRVHDTDGSLAHTLP